MIRALGRDTPVIHPTAYVDPTAVVIGRVRLGPRASVWPGAVLRGDIEAIVLGEGTNVQDNAVLHTDHGVPTVLGRGVTVGHGAILHSCTVEDDALIGMGAVVLGGAVVGRGALVGAGALVPPGAHVDAGRLALGAPARSVRKLTDGESRDIRENARRYIALSERHVRALRRPASRKQKPRRSAGA